MKPIYILLSILILILVSVITYNAGTKVNTLHLNSIDSTNTSLNKKVIVLEDSIKGLKAGRDRKERHTGIDSTISTFYEDCLRLEMTKKREGTNSVWYKKEEKNLDSYVLSHSYMLRSFTSNGKKIYQIELPSGEVISYEE